VAREIKGDKTRHLWYFISLLIAAIPITAIAGGIAGIIGMIVTWVGLVAIAGFAFTTIPKNREIEK
jgi:hypothetical protein